MWWEMWYGNTGRELLAPGSCISRQEEWVVDPGVWFDEGDTIEVGDEMNLPPEVRLIVIREWTKASMTVFLQGVQ